MDRRSLTLGLLALSGCMMAERNDKAAAIAEPVDEGRWLDINGQQQWLALRGRSAANPVLLFLHGGPGLGVASMMPLFDDWTRDYTVALWDQPASGFTGAKNTTSQGELSVEGYIRDGIAVADYLMQRFGGRPLVLMGMSWGTRLGLSMIRRRPELFAAFVGTAQPVGRRGDLFGYERALAGLRERGNAAGVEALERIGPPPFARFEDFLVRQQYTNPPAAPMSAIEASRYGAMGKALATSDPGASFIPRDLAGQGTNMAMFISTLAALWPEWQWEIRDFGVSWPIPMYVFHGSDDLNAPEPLASEWLAQIDAPRKAYEVIDGAGHNTLAFHNELLQLLQKHQVGRG
jgi:proline iminopeptidase